MKTYKEFTDEFDISEKKKKVVRYGKKVTINVPNVKKKRTPDQKKADKKRGKKMKGKKQKSSTIKKRLRSLKKSW